jgi:hypothetical protein
MHIEDIFEDLEAQFDSVTSKDTNHSSHLDARITDVKTTNFSMKLIAPIIGVDFIAGLDLAKPTWHIFSTRYLTEVRFLAAQDQTLPKVRQLDEAMATFLKHLPLPGRMRWRTFDNPEVERSGAVRGSSGGFLLTHQVAAANQTHVPILSLVQLSIDSLRFDSVED